MKTKNKLEAAYILSVTGENIIKCLESASNQIDNKGYTEEELLSLNIITNGLDRLYMACLQVGLDEIERRYND